MKTWMEKDPIPGYKSILIESGIITAKNDKDIEAEAVEELKKAVKFAEESPFPEHDKIEEDVYA